MRRSDENEDRQVQQQQEPEEPRRHQHDEQRGVRVGDASRLLSLSAGRAALRESVKVAPTGTAVASTAKSTSLGATAAKSARMLGAAHIPSPAPTKDGTPKPTAGAKTTQDDVHEGDAGFALADDDDDAGPAPFADDDDNDVGIEEALTAKAGASTAAVEDGTVAKKKTVPLGDVRRLMASKKGRAALRSAISNMTIESANTSRMPPAPIAAPAPAPVAAAAVPVQAQAQAPPPSQKRRRGGVPRRSRQQQEASTTEEASSNIAAKTKPTTPQETLAAFQSLDTASLHSLFNQILSSGVEPEDDVERDSEEVPTPRKLSAMREGPTREVEGSNGKDDEPLDLTFLLSDTDEVESSPEDGRGDEKKKAAAIDEDDESDDREEESEPVVGIGDMLVPLTQEQQQDAALSQIERAKGGSDEQPEGVGAKRLQDESESTIPKHIARGRSEAEEPVVPPKPQVVQRAPDADDANVQPDDESDEEDLSQETTQGSGENTAEGSPKKCPPTLRVRGQEEVDSDATVDENEASRQVAVAEKPKEHEIAESDSDTTACEAELRLPITSSKKITKPAPTRTATKSSSNQGARSQAVPPPKSRRRLYSAYDSSSSSDSDDWDTSTPTVATKKKEGNKKNTGKRLKHLGIAPPSAKKPRPMPKKASAPTFSIQAMLARKRS